MTASGGAVCAEDGNFNLLTSHKEKAYAMQRKSANPNLSTHFTVLEKGVQLRGGVKASDRHRDSIIGEQSNEHLNEERLSLCRYME